ncbi:MAG: recombinase family protein [Clostridiales bacterium]|nr:recombinase family protein [Clostridiales bacterium]
MNDIHEKAVERARSKLNYSPGSPQMTGNMVFPSEREKAKEALRSQVQSQNGQNVHKIAAIDDPLDPERILTVAAYCRVSTDDLNQVMSIELQKDEYKKKICGNPKWKYYGTFVDDGYSGTNTDHRKAFQLMIDHAMAGKFDMVITKSVSRFARNLMDCVKYVNLLRKHDPPIAVYFEAEGLNSLSLSTDLVLVVLAIVAEEESHMKSEAMLLSLEWRFSRGIFMTPSLLGYDKVKLDDDGRNKRSILRVNEEQARTVRLMYYMLLNGFSTTEIAQTLTDLHRWTGGRKKGTNEPNYDWTSSSVISTLRNERYCGDILARKTWTPNFKDHKSKKNRGKKNKYFQADHHEPIVTRAQWNAAQRILNSVNVKTYQPMRIVDHGILTGYISMNRFWGGFTPEDYYRAASIAMGLTEGELDADLENEYLPDGGLPLVGLAAENGILRIARELTKEEKRYQAEKNGIPLEEEEEVPTVQPIFQVVDGAMFSHAFEPVVRFSRNSLAFNSTCISKFNRLSERGGEVVIERVEYVELLFNPIERMVAVRPCKEDHPNAIPWCFADGTSRTMGATAMCNIFFSIMNWDTDFSFRVPASLKCCGEDRVLFFDLDNFIGSVKRTIQEEPQEEEEELPPVPENSSIFFSAEDEPQPLEETEAMQRRLDALAELEKHRFGKPAFDHESEIRIPEGDDWDIMAEARVLDINHSVDDRIVASLHDELQEELITNQNSGTVDTSPMPGIGTASSGMVLDVTE